MRTARVTRIPTLTVHATPDPELLSGDLVGILPEHCF